MAKKILIIEDDPATSRLIDYSLNHEGHRVFTTSNGPDGIRQALEESPDLIILDVMLPGMGGYEICHCLRSNPKTNDIPILMFSAKAQETDRSNGLLAGADEYLTKPASPSDIISWAETLLKKKSHSAISKKKTARTGRYASLN
jgi:DNA-binding response OmpR family regulator